MALRSRRQESGFIRSLKYWVPVLLWMMFIFWMSSGMFSTQNTASIVEPVIRFFAPSTRPETIDVIHGVLRKLGHVSEYFVLGLLLFRAMRGGSKELRIARWVLSSLLVLALYAASDEFHQSFVAARTASPRDVGIDILGGITALTVSALPYLGLKQRR